MPIESVPVVHGHTFEGSQVEDESVLDAMDVGGIAATFFPFVGVKSAAHNLYKLSFKLNKQTQKARN